MTTPEKSSVISSYEGDELDDLAKMRQRFKEAEEAEGPNRAAASDAISFFYGESQWDDKMQRQRESDNRPCLTLNKLPAILKQVLNESSQNKPAIQINPVGDGADEDTAEAIQGLCRHVESNSDGAAAYENAFVYMLVGGFGSWRILHDYLPKSFDQELFIEMIPSPFSCYWDPSSVKRDRSDARYAFITSDLSKDAHDEQFPDSELTGLADMVGAGDRAPGWSTSKSIRVVEYFWIECEQAELVKLTDGRSVWEDEMKSGDRIAKGVDKKPQSRMAERRVAWVAKSNGIEWLEKPAKLPTDDIPIVTLYGNEMIVDGEKRSKGMVADLMEPQRIFNYDSSAIAETMALGTKANWLATVEQIEPYMDLWKQANSRNMAVLPYRNMPGVAPPQKISTEPPIQAMSAARMQAADDLRSISGVYDATQSPNGGEESGRAILARRHQTSTGNLNYTAILAAGVKRTAQILLKYFPVIYDTARVMRITGTDMQPQQIMVHSGQPDSVPPQIPEGVKAVFDLSVGTYDVTVSVGPTYDSKRQESVEMLLSLIQANPNLGPLIADLAVNEMDIPGKKAIVERLQKALPPNLQDQGAPGDPAQLQAHNQQLMTQNQALMAQVQQITQALQTEQIKAASREKVETLKLQSSQVAAQSRVEQANIAAQAAILKEAASKHVGIVHDHALADKQNQHEHAMSTKDQIHSMMNQQSNALAPPPAPEPAGA